MWLQPCAICFLSILILSGLAGVDRIRAQDVKPVTTSSDWAWKPVLNLDGIEVEYIFYAEKESVDDGVVMKLVNNNDYDVRYSFTVVIRSEDSVFEKKVTGVVKARTLITGDEAGLYWVPFKGGESIGELGIRAYRFRRTG